MLFQSKTLFVPKALKLKSSDMELIAAFLKSIFDFSNFNIYDVGVK